PTCPTNVSLWTSLGTTMPIAAQTGVVIAISGLKNLPTAGLTLAQICGQVLTQCFDSSNDPPTVGVNFIRGWTNSGSGTQPNPPLLRDVEVVPKDCPLGLGLADPYFALLSGKCNVTLAAMVDAALSGGGAPGSLNITVVGAGCPNKGCALAPDNAVPASQECA